MHCRAILISLFLLFVVTAARANAYTDSILSRYRQYFLHAISFKGVDEYVPKYAFNLSASSQWSDIDYADTSPSYWQTRDHLGRVVMLSIAWASPASAYYHNPQVWQTFSRALDHWLLKRYTNSNWWVNEIGVPQDMRNILVLAGSNLSNAQRAQALEVLAQHRVRGIGANLIWSADLAIHYGALVNDEAMIKKSSELISREIKVTTGEGIQPDYSYHQHESRLQIYHYGLSFLETNVRIAWEMRGTPWRFSPSRISILTRFILNGWQWMSRGINTVPGTIDRAASRKDQLHNADLRGLIPFLADLDPGHRYAFTAIADRQNGRGVPLTGFRYFPYSDFAAYHHPGFSFLIKTISTRTLKSESINTENIKGRLMNNGDGYLISNGNEYFNLMPAWNWNFLPGQTNVNTAGDTIVTRPYAGSVTDGKTGLTAMDYAVAGPGKSITAHKAWACHGNTVVCLISDVQAAGPADSIFTALDQSRWQAPVEADTPGRVIGTGVMQLEKVRWIHHASFGYILLEPSTVRVEVKETTSSWSVINKAAPATPVSEKVFMPLLYHNGTAHSSTGYVSVFAKTSAEVEALARHPTWQVCRNDAACQAVRFSDGVFMAAFYAPAQVTLPGGKTISADRPCLVQLAGNRLFISDPLHQGGPVTIRLNSKTYKASLNSDGTSGEW